MSKDAASSTSVYTNVEKKETYNSLDDILREKCSSDSLKTVIKDLMAACVSISTALRTALVTVEGSSNTFGDTLLSVDVIADKLLWDTAHKSSAIREAASEEDPVVRPTPGGGGGGTAPATEYTVCWDPLDGSSIVDNNWAVGTMIGVWNAATGLIGATGRDQLTALVAQYGPRLTVLVALDDGVYEFTHGSDAGTTTSRSPWICSRERIAISPRSKIFSPANLRAAQDLSRYGTLVSYYMTNRYTLRYTGGMVPDVYQQFTKGMGVFANPTSAKSPAKLRLAFEAAPFGFLVERAGGKTSDGVSGGSILDVRIEGVDQRTAVCMGSAEEVERFNEMICKAEG